VCVCMFGVVADGHYDGAASAVTELGAVSS